jgi:hypothetical protein
MPTIPHWLWGVWAGGILTLAAWFGVMEGIAIANGFRSHDTLSEAVWEHARLPAVVLFLGAGLVIFGTIWLLIHFVSKGRLGI